MKGVGRGRFGGGKGLSKGLEVGQCRVGLGREGVYPLVIR